MDNYELFKLEVEQLSLQEGRDLKGASQSQAGGFCSNGDDCGSGSGGFCSNDC